MSPNCWRVSDQNCTAAHLWIFCDFRLWFFPSFIGLKLERKHHPEGHQSTHSHTREVTFPFAHKGWFQTVHSFCDSLTPRRQGTFLRNSKIAKSASPRIKRWRSTLTVFYSNKSLLGTSWFPEGEMTSSGANHSFQGQPFGFTEKSVLLGGKSGLGGPQRIWLKPG